MKTDPKRTYTIDETNDFVDNMIEESDGRFFEEQGIDNLIVIQKFDDVKDYAEYLEKIFPNRFYEGKFRVLKCEIEKIKEYMKAELALIKNCPLSFKNRYLSERVESSLQSKSSTEISGIYSVFYNNMVCTLKENKFNEDRFISVDNFSPLMDFNHTDRHQKIRKAEMVIIPFRNRYFIIRMTEKGYFTIAVHICDLWARKKEIASYYSTEERSISCARKFRYENSKIVESKDNEEENIRLSGEDYWILSYNLKNGSIVYAAMLPLDII
jgi:hypothetical protein